MRGIQDGKKLTFQKVYEIATAMMEFTLKNVAVLQCSGNRRQ